MLCDARGLPVSHANAAALEAYERALVSLRSYRGDPLAAIEEVLALAPGLGAGHSAKALIFMTLFERRFAREALQALQAGEDALARSSPREQLQAAAARRLAQGDWEGGVRTLDSILVDHPHDLLSLQVAHLVDFVRGDSLNLRNRITRVLPHWSPELPGYAFVHGMHAFGLEECNQYDAAEQAGMNSLALAPEDCWAVHAITHVHEMRGHTDKGIAFLEARRADWATEDNGFAFHNWWHLALFHLDHGNYARVLALYDERLAGGLEMAISRVDATAMLWRLVLEGVEVGDRFEKVADAWETPFAQEGGFYAFNDFHAVLAFAATGRRAAIEEARKALRRALDVPGSNAFMTRTVALDACEGVIAWSEQRFDDAVDHLVAIRDGASRFGGSHAQRDVITLTVIDAATRAGRHRLSRHYLAERLVQKPAGLWGRRLAARMPSPLREGVH